MEEVLSPGCIGNESEALIGHELDDSPDGFHSRHDSSDDGSTERKKTPGGSVYRTRLTGSASVVLLAFGTAPRLATGRFYINP